MQKTHSSTQQIFSGFSAEDSEKIERALAIIAQIPEPLPYQRPTGVDTAAILMDFKVDVETILAAILSDPRLEELKPKPDIAKEFGKTVAALVKDINWLNKLNVYSTDMMHHPNQAETLRRMLLSMTQDMRAVLIKLAYRIKRLRILPKEAYEIRHFVAQETLDIYAPIANRLGIHQFKWELEDMAFRYLEPQIYLKIAKSLAAKREQRKACIEQFIQVLHTHLDSEGIKAEIYGRPKHIYSIWKKMQRKQLDIDELYDLLAVRVIVDNLTSCYAVLGIVHGAWQTIPKEFDDYIANPKENGYQSLHTVILDPQGNRIEVQIRTKEMHEFAEMGVAAHWSYKEGGKHNAALDKSIASLRKLLEEKDNDENITEDFRSELFHDRVYVLTPAGKLIDLVKGSTPLDFAYAIHTEIGHSCRGAKVNGRICPLTYALKSGEQVEILTTKDIRPNRNWIDPNLGYLKSAHAIGKVKSWFKHQQRDQNIAVGKTILDREIQHLGLKGFNIKELTLHFKQPDTDTLLEAIGRNDINSRQLAAFFKIPELEPQPALTIKKKPETKSVVTVEGIDNVLTTLAQCCMPVLGDDIMGYITHHRGITIHRKDCNNLTELSPEKHTQLIPVFWGTQKASHSVPIVIRAYNARHLLNNVTQVLGQANIHISNAALETNPDFSAVLNLTIQIENTRQLSLVLSRISQLPNIVDVKRKT
ncbi:GTP pyrophosphokinase RelA [Methyloglobulus morosus KoM1]|uniref:GTP pyrophosphokinase n=1 Tax=Methyloglobulus morosus KoM1 TaxID=1116472 RepID=V5BYL0_9GAMM|nr:bifunctional (p)ppGpp synthetase/guanosine-3',5'-bis(diphosphate) 3'-pyrophosphohydrolase [Methyloglobulus morosus]ESS71347.1 GTP pyrophosphokinase RelA [Methyloglobulus morosus KoM1]